MHWAGEECVSHRSALAECVAITGERRRRGWSQVERASKAGSSEVNWRMIHRQRRVRA